MNAFTDMTQTPLKEPFDLSFLNDDSLLLLSPAFDLPIDPFFPRSLGASDRAVEHVVPACTSGAMAAAPAMLSPRDATVPQVSAPASSSPSSAQAMFTFAFPPVAPVQCAAPAIAQTPAVAAAATQEEEEEQDPVEEDEENEEFDQDDMHDDDDEEEDEEYVARAERASSSRASSSVAATRRSKRRRAVVERATADEDGDDLHDDDDDEFDAELGEEKYTRVRRIKDMNPEEEQYLRTQLSKQMRELEMCNTGLKGMSTTERKKLRNRKASRVSRLKKKLSLFDLQAKYDELAAQHQHAQTQVESQHRDIQYLVSEVRRYNPGFHFRSSAELAASVGASAPAVIVAPPTTAAKSGGRKRVKLEVAPLAAAVAAAPVERPSCHCTQANSDDMLPCHRCGTQCHVECLLLSLADMSYRCSRCR